MLGKLLKYEFKATYKIFAVMYLAFVIVAVICGAGLTYGNDQVARFVIMLLMFASVPPIVIYFIVTEGRFKNMYSDEGYLLFTLPVKNYMIPVSRFIVGVVWGVLTIFAAAVIFAATTCAVLEGVRKGNAMELIGHSIALLDRIGVANVAAVVAFMLMICVLFVARMFFSIAFVNLPFIKRGGGLIAVVIFFVSLFIEGKILSAFEPDFITSAMHNMPELYMNGYSAIGMLSAYYSALYALAAVFYITLVCVFVSKKLSLK